MEKTAQDANKSTQMLDQGRHHIGDFLPPEELSKFMNKYKVYLPIDCFQVLFKFLRCSHRKLDSCSRDVFETLHPMSCLLQNYRRDQMTAGVTFKLLVLIVRPSAIALESFSLSWLSAYCLVSYTISVYKCPFGRAKYLEVGRKAAFEIYI